MTTLHLTLIEPAAVTPGQLGQAMRDLPKLRQLMESQPSDDRSHRAYIVTWIDGRERLTLGHAARSSTEAIDAAAQLTIGLRQAFASEIAESPLQIATEYLGDDGTLALLRRIRARIERGA